MAAVTVTTARIAPVYPEAAHTEIYPVLAGTAITPGDAAFFGTADGRLARTRSGVAGASVFHGLALEAAGSAQVVDLLRRGPVFGFDLSNVAYGGTVYAGTAAGTFDDTVVGGTVIVGICMPLSDSDRTKVLYVNAPWR